jgi:hypothetical protein
MAGATAYDLTLRTKTRSNRTVWQRAALSAQHVPEAVAPARVLRLPAEGAGLGIRGPVGVAHRRVLRRPGAIPPCWPVHRRRCSLCRSAMTVQRPPPAPHRRRGRRNPHRSSSRADRRVSPSSSAHRARTRCRARRGGRSAGRPTRGLPPPSLPTPAPRPCARDRGVHLRGPEQDQARRPRRYFGRSPAGRRPPARHRPDCGSPQFAAVRWPRSRARSGR